MVTSERNYPIRRPIAAAMAGGAVAILGGLIGLGGAEFRLPILITVFALFAHRAIRINLLISLATLMMSAASRLGFVQNTHVADYGSEIAGMLAGGIIAAWFGAGYLKLIPKDRIMGVIAALLMTTAVLLVVETMVSGTSWTLLASVSDWRVPVAVVLGLLVGAISSLLGVAGGEFIIPILMFIFGADIKTAGTASVLISIPIVLTGVARHWRTGHYQSQSMLMYLAVPMAVGSVAGALVGGYLAAWVPTNTIRLVLALILAASSFKLWTNSH